MKKTISQNWGCFAVVSIILLIIVGRLIYVKVQTHVINGEYPIDKIVIYHHWVTIYPKTNTVLQDFVDMSLFYGFKPKMTFSDAVNAFGEPDNIREEDRGNTYYEYWRDNARIEVGKEEYSTGNRDNPIGVAWALYSYPKNASYIQVLNPRIINAINPNLPKTIVTIKNQDGSVGVLLDVRGNRVQDLIWYE